MIESISVIEDEITVIHGDGATFLEANSVEDFLAHASKDEMFFLVKALIKTVESRHKDPTDNFYVKIEDLIKD